MTLPVTCSDVRVESAPDPERAEALSHYICSFAADATAVMARLFYVVLSAYPECTCPLFYSGGESLFKIAVRHARTDREWEALEELRDDDVRLALSMACYALERPERPSAGALVFATPPPAPRAAPRPSAALATTG